METEETKDIERIFEEGTLIDEALDTAVREALRRHRLAGNPVVIYRDGKAVWVSAEEAEAECGRRPS